MKERSSAHERKKHESEERFLNRPEIRQSPGERFYASSKWYWKQSCAKYRIHIDRLLTEIDDLIKTQNTLRKQINQLQSNIETLVANLKNVENYIKTKTKIENVSRYKKMLKSITRLDPDDFLVIFNFVNTETHCESAKFYGS